MQLYPHPDDSQKGSLQDRIEVLMDAAERFKAIVLDDKLYAPPEANNADRKLGPRDLQAAYNWEEISRVLRDVREMPEATPADKTRKGNLLAKLAEVYEVLRAAKMAKLEAVRLALISEANQLRGGTQVSG